MDWYALHTKPRQELLAQTALAREGLETFFPKLKRKRTIRRVRKWTVGPLFPNYIFARFAYAKDHRLVKYANGVSTIVGFGGRPAVVDEQIIDGIRTHCEAVDAAAEDTVVLPPASFRPGEIVEIKAGPLMGMQGIFEREMSDRDRVVVLLETLARGARVEVSREELERIDG